MSEKYYVTAAIPYVNAKPHIGHALEFVQTDVLKRYHKLIGEDSISLSGGDENALKNVQAAEKANEEVQSFVDKNTESFRQLAIALNAEFDIWQKGSSEAHHKASQKLWNLVKENNPADIYKKSYSGLYCVGCETFYIKDELNENGECFEHPGKKLEEVEEENYFFRLSAYEDKLIELIESGKLEIIPEKRKNEVLQFIKSGLEDISISRSNDRAKNWGVQVPDDNTQRMYVWFDALNIYQSGIGFGSDDEKYNKYWPADAHVIGKGILRFHAVYWPAFLLSAGLKLPKKIYVHEYFTVDGQKMSKTLGNVIDPVELINEYGEDALRYYFLAKFSPFTDGDFSKEKLIDVYNADLANGIGNLVSRVAKLCQNSGFEFEIKDLQIDKQIFLSIDNFEFNKALSFIWEKVSNTDQYLSDKKPWQIEDKSKLKEILQKCIDEIRLIARDLEPFLPETSEKISKIFSQTKIKAVEKPLFKRI